MQNQLTYVFIIIDELLIVNDYIVQNLNGFDDKEWVRYDFIKLIL